MELWEIMLFTVGVIVTGYVYHYALHSMFIGDIPVLFHSDHDNDHRVLTTLEDYVEMIRPEMYSISR